MVGAQLPDADFVVRYTRGGEVNYLKKHRGPSHGLATLPLQAGVVAGILHWLAPAAPLGTLFWWTLAGCLSHVLSDLTNDYGTQGFWPFSRRWIALDLIPIFDVYLAGIIGAGWLVTWLGDVPRAVAFIGVWGLIALYVWLRVLLRNRALALANSAHRPAGDCGDAAPCGPGWPGERATVHPTLFSLNAWRYVIQQPGEYAIGTVWVFSGKVGRPHRAVNQMDAIVKASLGSQLVTAFAAWVRRPRVEVIRQADLYQVRWVDARYEVDGHSPFAAVAWLDENLTLIDERFGPRLPPEATGEDVRRRLRKELGKDDL